MRGTERSSLHRHYNSVHVYWTGISWYKSKHKLTLEVCTPFCLFPHFDCSMSSVECRHSSSLLSCIEHIPSSAEAMP